MSSRLSLPTPALFQDTLFLRFIAVLLITNSHLDSLYPIPGLASGGALGNAIFFMLSGLGLALSSQKKLPEHFLSWFSARATRIYPALWISLACLSLLTPQPWTGHDWVAILQGLFYPTSFWFISALILFYGLIYPILKAKLQARTLLCLIAGLCLPYFYVYYTRLHLSGFVIEDSSQFKWLFYFQIMLFGVWLAQRYPQLKQPKIRDGALLALGLCLYIGFKFLIAHGQFSAFQFLIHWLTFPTLYYLLKVAQAPTIARWLNTRYSGTFISLMGTCTLEIYLLQHTLYTLAWLKPLGFPLGVLCFWGMLLPLAYVVHRVSTPLQRLLSKAIA